MLSGSEDVKFHSSSSVDDDAAAACVCAPPVAIGVDVLFVAAANGLEPREPADTSAANGSAVVVVVDRKSVV